jgi:hypothetical protein
MNNINMNDQIRMRRKNALPALIAAGAIFLISWAFLGFGAIAIIALIFFLMIGWYFLTIGEKLQRWQKEELAATENIVTPTKAVATYGSSIPAELGEFLLDEDSEQWLAYPKGRSAFPMFAIAADWNGTNEVLAPDFDLMNSVLMISKNIDEFEVKVRSFLTKEAARKDLSSFEAEIAKLQIGRISFLWQKRPKEGLIHFIPQGAGKVWVCDLSDGAAVAESLRFDT